MINSSKNLFISSLIDIVVVVLKYKLYLVSLVNKISQQMDILEYLELKDIVKQITKNFNIFEYSENLKNLYKCFPRFLS